MIDLLRKWVILNDCLEKLYDIFQNEKESYFNKKENEKEYLMWLQCCLDKHYDLKVSCLSYVAELFESKHYETGMKIIDSFIPFFSELLEYRLKFEKEISGLIH